MGACKRLLLAVAAAAMIWTVFEPEPGLAQSSGVGGDGYTRMLWRRTDSSISLWKLDPSLNMVSVTNYGPYTGWFPIALTTAPNNNTYMLWNSYNGMISLWMLDVNLNFVNSKTYGPYTGYIAQGLSVGSGTNNNFRVIWREYDGTASIWNVDSNLNMVNSPQYGPYISYDPGSPYPAAQTSGIGGDGYTRMLWRRTDSSVSLWKLDPNLNMVSVSNYGPYTGWFPIALCTAPNNNTYMLWNGYDGRATLWQLDSNLNFVNSTIYGPYTGYLAQGLSCGTATTDNSFRVIWREYDGTASIWYVNSNLNMTNSPQYGPYISYDPVPVSPY